MEQNDRLEKNKYFFQGKELFNTKLLQWLKLKKEMKNVFAKTQNFYPY